MQETEKFPLSGEEARKMLENYHEIRAMQHLYNAAIKEICTKLEILNDEFKVTYSRNPIHHIESRLKSTDSIIKKLAKRGYPLSIDSAKKNLNDIAGIRVVCYYIDDVYSVEEALLRHSDLKLVDRTDYIKTPNYNGYRSLHLDLEVPIYLYEKTEYITAGVQIRSVAMDFWASLEHDLRYKSTSQIPAELPSELLQCADEIAEIDRRMQGIYNRIKDV